MHFHTEISKSVNSVLGANIEFGRAEAPPQANAMEPVLLKYEKLATKYSWIYEYFTMHDKCKILRNTEGNVGVSTVVDIFFKLYTKLGPNMVVLHVYRDG